MAESCVWAVWMADLLLQERFERRVTSKHEIDKQGTSVRGAPLPLLVNPAPVRRSARCLETTALTALLISLSSPHSRPRQYRFKIEENDEGEGDYDDMDVGEDDEEDDVACPPPCARTHLSLAVSHLLRFLTPRRRYPDRMKTTLNRTRRSRVWQVRL